MKGKTKAPGGGPKLPKVTAMMFDEINAQAPNFTIDQQRELIVFELKEQIRSITSEAYNQEEDAAKASKELELHTEEIKLHISNFLDQTLTRIYSQFKVMSNNFEDSMNDSVMNLNQSVLKPRIKTTISQGVQTTGIDASFGTRETTELLSEKEKLIKTQKVLDEERQLLLRTNQKLNDLVQSLLKQLYHGQAGPSLPEEPSKAEECGFSEGELKNVFGTVSDLVASVNQLRGQLNQAVIERAKLIKTVRVLMMENEKKGNFIVQMQKKFKERKSMLYTAMKQSEVMSKEKEILKGVAKAFYEESSHYQDECGRLSLQNVQMRLSMEEEIAANKASIEQMERFMEALLAKFSKEVMHDRERETQIAASFTKLRSMYAGRLEELRQVMRDACMRYDSLSNFVESSIRSYENEFRYLHEQLELRTDQHRELSAKVKTLSTKITHEISHSAKLEEELRDTRGLLKIKEEEADQAKDELEALEKELSSKREELALLLVDSDSRDKEHKEMIQEVYDSIASERQEILAGLNHVLQGAGLVTLEDAIPEAMIGSTKTIREHIAALINQNHELSVKTAQETEELKAALDLKIEQLQGQLEESKVVIDTLTESARMQSHIVIERQKTSSDTELSLMSEVSTLQTQLEETRKHLQAKDEASITLLEDLNTKKEEIKKLEGYLETWQEQVHQLTKELTDKQKTIDELEAEKLKREQRAEPEDSQNVPKDVDKDETSSQNEEFSAELEKLKMELKAEREAKEEAIHEVSRQ